MLLTDLTGKSVCILGYGREGRAMLNAVERANIACDISIADNREDVSGEIETQRSKRKMQTGPTYLKNLERFDIIIKSPGIPPCPELEAIRSKITNATQIFLDEASAAGAVVIGVTGSKGKSTTASLLAAMLQHGSRDATLVGNIGKPALQYVHTLKKNKIFVHEMSSYQLADCTSSPPIAVITSFFPEHLDYHGATATGRAESPLAAYMDAKKRITAHQQRDDIVFFNAESAGSKEIADASPGNRIAVTMADAPIALERTKLIGKHNLMNIALAAAVARHLGMEEESVLQAIMAFAPLPHRLQPCGEHGGIEWVDDSISTTPESAIAALDALGEGVQTVILGGQDRGSDFAPLAERIRRSNVRTVILMGQSAARIRAALDAASTLTDVHYAQSMTEAVRQARSHTEHRKERVPIVLLSPASPSYDMFENFEERGTAFLQAILNT